MLFSRSGNCSGKTGGCPWPSATPAARQHRRRHRGRRCVSRKQGLGRTLGTPGKDKPSRAAIHARRPPVGISNRVSTGKTSYPPVACKRLRKPTRARATTVWHESNVSWAFKFFSQQAMDCCVGHFRIMLPAALRRIIRSLFAGADLQGSDWRTGLGFGAWARGGRPPAHMSSAGLAGRLVPRPAMEGILVKRRKAPVPKN